jgi:p-aminobenzoyl-glutamate transporter AbgT
VKAKRKGKRGDRQVKSAVFEPWIQRLLSLIERGGNALPHPATLFAGLAVLVVLLSGIFSRLDLAVEHPATGS